MSTSLGTRRSIAGSLWSRPLFQSSDYIPLQADSESQERDTLLSEVGEENRSSLSTLMPKIQARATSTVPNPALEDSEIRTGGDNCPDISCIFETLKKAQVVF